MRRFLLLSIFITSFVTSKAQNLSYTCPRDTILGCSSACFTIKAQFPDIRAVGDNYTLKEVTPVSICRPYIGPDVAGPSTELDVDDTYSDVIPIGFNFPFYGTTYTSLVASTNGYLSFDVSLANGGAAWVLTGNVPTAAYDGALIMGPWHDLDPTSSIGTSPTQQIKYNLVGTAPNRKWVLSFYKVPLFSMVCNPLIENTHQIVLHESTGIIEVFIFDKQQCPTWNSGKAMIGLQDITATKGIVPPGRGASDPPWGTVGMNEVWRFIPTGGAPLYRSVQLLNGAGTVVATGDTTRVDVNTFETSFPNICPPTGASIYVVKTTYAKLDDPTSTIFSLDTINITRQSTLPVSATMTPTTCGGNTGTITVTTGGGGTPPFQYSIDGGTLQPSNVFTGVTAGPHTMYAIDATGCNGTFLINVTSISSLPSTIVKTNTSCPGLNNGTITVTPTAGTAPFSYSINGGAGQVSNIFTNLAPGTYIITFTDANACASTSTSVTIAAGTAITSTDVTIGSACTGANNGSTTVTPTSGTAPYQYSIDGGANQASNVFTGLAPGNHTVTITDANGCTGTNAVFISTGAGITSNGTTTPTSCPGVNNGTITVTPTNGTAPYTYSADGGPFQASNVLTGLSPTIHTITIRDANNCTGTLLLVITTGIGISATATSTGSSCPGAMDGTITVTASSGTAPYTYSLDGGTFQLSNIFNAVTSGPHTATVKDVNGCTGTAAVTVTTGAGIAGTATSTASSCPGASNGTITVTATTGTAPYTYSLDAGAFQASNIFSAVTSGAHTVTIKDANGCTGTVPVTVTTGAAITGSASTTATACPGINNGIITVTAITGTAPYTYSSDGGVTFQPGNIFTAQSAGSHTITIKDANGCTGLVTATVIQGVAITGTAASTGTSCPGVSDGTITVTASTGTAPYTYSIDGGASQPGNIFTGLASGAHTATFQDANGCTATVNVSVVAGINLTGTASSTATSCPTVNNGTVTVTATSGTAPYTYSIDGGASQPGNIFTGLSSGAHTATFQDANGCTGTASVTVVAGISLTGTASSTATSCPTVNNGTVTVTATSGTAPYTYSIDGGTFQPGNTFTGLVAGPHIITFRDVNGCTGTVNVIVNGGTSLTSSSSSTATSCPTVNNGTVTITATSGTAPYTYSIDGGVFLPGNTFTNLASGLHIVTFQDVNGCTGTANITVAAGSSLTGTLTSTATSCPTVNNGTLTVTATSGTAPYTYSSDGGVTFQASNIFSGLTSGSHSITIRDAIGCRGIVTATVPQGAAITGSAVATGTSCPGVNNGTVTVTVATGTAPYTYSIDGGASQPANVFTGLASGPHTVTFQDAVGCPGTRTVTVAAGTGLTSTQSIIGTSCPGVNNGSITVTPTSGTIPYQYSIDGGTAQPGNVFLGLTAGSHTITFTDALGCIGTTIRTVPAGASLVSTTSVSNPPCANINDGTITITPTTGVAPYLYSLNGSPTQPANIFTGLTPGIPYNITFTDAIGCVGTKSVTLTTNTAITTTVTKIRPLCNGNANGSIRLNPAGGIPAYQYSKDGGLTYQPGNTFTGLTAGTHTFRIKDNVGCIKDTTVTLTEPALLLASATSTAGTCNGNDGVITVSRSGGTPPFQYSIDNGLTYQSSNSFIVSGGSYPNVRVKDANGCIANTSVIVTLIDNMVLTLGPDSTICVGNSVSFQPQTNPEANIFQWSSENASVSIPAGTIDNDTIKNATVTPVDTFSYVLTATWGVCTKKDTIVINVLHKPVANAGLDTAICFDQTVAILQGSAGNVSGPVFYSWTDTAGIQNPDTSYSFVTLYNTTLFTLTVKDNYGCNFSVNDQVLVSVQPPVQAFAGNDTLAIRMSPHQLMASGGTDYSWTPTYPFSGSSPFIANPLAVLDHDQQFVVEVKDIAGCIGYDTVFIKAYDGPGYYVPNAFSPNGDGLNDVFRVIPIGITRTDYFRIFNRYGELIFETNQWLKGWDGTYLGKKQQIGTYVWILKGINKFGRVVEMQGTVLIVQ